MQRGLDSRLFFNWSSCRGFYIGLENLAKGPWLREPRIIFSGTEQVFKYIGFDLLLLWQELR